MENIVEFDGDLANESFRVTARTLLGALQTNNANEIRAVFAHAGHVTSGDYVLPKTDTVLENTIIHITIDTTDLRKVMRDYIALKQGDAQVELDWIISLCPETITYFWKTKEIKKLSLRLTKSKKRKNDNERVLDILTSLMAVISRRAAYNAETFAYRYGKYSPLYFYALNRLTKRFQEEKLDRINVVFSEWKRRFEEVYREGDTTKELFLNHTYLACLIQLVVFVTYFPKEDLKTKSIIELISWLEERGISLFTPDFFTWALAEGDLIEILFYGLRPLSINGKAAEQIIFEADDIFRTIYQQMVSPTTRQALGEFYTPPELAQMMVTEAYEFGQVVLDPACGSGTFIVEIMRRIRSEQSCTEEERLIALQRVYGFDVNPIAVATARANILLRLKDLVNKHENLIINVFLCNSLFPPSLKRDRPLGPYLINEKADLIIGNPPWLVLNNIHSVEYKERVKNLAKDLKIAPKPHQQTHLEMCALFIYRVKRYLKDRGRIFFIVSNSVITGDNHAGTRQFLEFDDIKMWKFTTDVFNIHNICLSLHYLPGKTRSNDELRQLPVQTTTFDAHRLKSGELVFTPVKEELYVPYNVEVRTGYSLAFVKKLIPASQVNDLLPLGNNEYKNQFYKGASLFPRNLVFVTLDGRKSQEDDAICRIRHVLSNPKKPWDFDPLKLLNVENAIVERKFIFRALKSTEVVPFAALNASRVFLPIEKNEETGGYQLTNDQNSHGWQHFEKLDQLYKVAQKEGASIQSLWGNISHQGKLTAPRQVAPIKVVMMDSGTLVKACLVKDKETIIDNTNLFIGLDSEDEAYYLLGFLNAPCVTKTVQEIQAEGAGGGGRHIHKRPFEIQLPKYDPHIPLHQLIVKHAKRMETKAQQIIRDWISQEKSKLIKNAKEQITIGQVADEDVLKPKTLQNRIYTGLGWDTKHDRITNEYRELDTFVQKLIIGAPKQRDAHSTILNSAL